VIHSTAIVRGSVNIHPTARVDPYAVITGPVQIGARAYIGSHAVIGAPAQHSDTAPAPRAPTRDGAGVVIGADTCVREFATIHQGVVQATRVGNDSLLMAGCHIAHDSLVGNRVTMGSFTILGGFTYIGDDATFGQGCVTHPWSVIGAGAMVGLNSSIIRDVDAFAKVAGAPARIIGRNDKKLADHAFGAEQMLADHEALCRARDDTRNAWYSAQAS
jgi:UDP-N-acetylglucosamine acyltransferase